MRDLGPSEAEANANASNRMTNVLNRAGFQPLDTPVLEPTDLFVRKSGGEVSSSLYSFQDPGGMSVSLRPEFTPSIIRWYIENAASVAGPRRYRYSGPVFRYAGARRGRFRQFQQVGAELIGVSGPSGDVEILTAAVRCLRSVGLSDFTLRLGHIGMIHDIVQAQGLSDQVEMFIISNLAEIGGADYKERLLESATAAGLVVEEPKSTPVADGLDKAMPELEVIRRSISGPTGRRSPGRILARLASRMTRACSGAELVCRAGKRRASHLSQGRGLAGDRGRRGDTQIQRRFARQRPRTRRNPHKTPLRENQRLHHPPRSLFRARNDLLHRHRLRVPERGRRGRLPDWRRRQVR